MCYFLDVLTMKENHTIAQVQAYLRVCSDETKPLHKKIGRVSMDDSSWQYIAAM